jgi:outer membrane immunogenic protein
MGEIFMRTAILSAAILAAIPIASASAADMPVKAPPAAPPAVFSWTGFYVGGEFGGGESRTDSIRNVGNASFPAGFTETIDESGFLGGVDIGANYQINQFVLGVEGDWQGSTLSSNDSVASPLVPGRFTVENREVDWVSTVTGRVGWAWDRWLLYAKGGGAWRHVNDSASNETFSGAGVLLTNQTVNSETESGYVVGGGVEWAFSQLVSLKAEYDWYDFGSGPSTGGVCLAGAGCGGAGAIVAPGESTNTSRQMWEVKGGINIHWNFLSGAIATRD